MTTKVTNFIKNFFSHFTFHISRCQAFTLAEVLITLGIIGVIAGITLPTLISNYQKQQTVEKLKKAYTEISQAIKLSEIDNGPNQSWDWGIQNTSFEAIDSFNTYWKPYLKTQEICRSYTDCGYTKSTWDIVKGTNGLYLMSSGSRTLLVLSDGVIILIMSHSTLADGTVAPTHDVYVDINGGKKPNTIGLDVFEFKLNAGGLIPPTPAVRCTTNNSLFCSAKIIQDGWQIKDDYPWK